MLTASEHFHLWYPGAYWGYTPSWSAVDLDLVVRACGVSILLCVLLALARRALARSSMPTYTTIKNISVTAVLTPPAHDMGVVVWTMVNQLHELLAQAVGAVRRNQFGYIGVLALYILLCNWAVLVGVHEPTADYNMTLALALTTFLWIQKEAIGAHGIIGYVGEFIKTPFAPRLSGVMDIIRLPFLLIANLLVATISLPLELVGKCSQVLSLSFRLFGNIMAGSVVWGLWQTVTKKYLLARLVGIAGVNIVLLGFFGVFEGLIQAFVFTMLATTYLGIATGSGQQEHAS